MKIKKNGDRKKKIAHIIIGSVLCCVVLCSVLCVLIIAKIISRAPSMDDIKGQQGRYTSFVLDQDGSMIDTFTGIENVEYAYIDQIPDHLKEAIIAIEDPKFYTHQGVDFSKFTSSLFHREQSEYTEVDGSTITQQIIRNNYPLSEVNPIERKIDEAYLAMEVEKIYSKDDLLEYYLNNLQIGSDMIGVQKAAMRFFGEEVEDLGLTECAVLAAYIERPTYCDPCTNPESNWQGVKKVLDQMLEQGYISESEKEAALSSSPYEKINYIQKEDNEAPLHSDFVNAVYEQVVKDLQKQRGISQIEAKAMVYGGGLQIYTTQDTKIQEIVDRIMSDKNNYPEAIQNEGLQAAFVITDYQTGQVKALYGGFDEKQPGHFDYGTKALRMPGATFHILAGYAPAVDACGYTAESEVKDEKLNIALSNDKIYFPKNVGGGYSNANISLKEALAGTINTIPVKLVVDCVGIEKAYEYVSAFGFEHVTEEDQTPALPLGGLINGVTLLELNMAYGAIAHQGNYMSPLFYTKVEDREGNIVLDGTSETLRGKTQEVIDKKTADTLTQMLQYAVEKGTAQSVRSYMKEMPIAGQVGALMNQCDAVFVGYTPYYVGAIWSGYAQMQQIPTHDHYELALWGKIMNEVHQSYQVKSFEK